MNPVIVERTCRYGHGALKHVDKMTQSKVNFGLVMFRAGAIEDGALSGLSLWVCKSCGYTELVDDDVGQTLRNMEEK